MFSIPTHQYLFNPELTNIKSIGEVIQLEESEQDLMKYLTRGCCLYRCGNERYLLQVKAPEYKSVLFGKSGGR